MKHNQSGFTLVEIAIVLVIIGLLLGGVLKGQELINSARVKNMVGDFRTVSALVYGYQDRFRAFPGDQNQNQLTDAFGANAVAGQPPNACGGAAGCIPNNGRLDGNWNDPVVAAGSSETVVFWQHVRLANLATGPLALNDANYLHVNADGGRIGVESGLAANGVPAPFIAGMRGAFFICSDAILGRYARQIDSTMDDGNTASGTVQVVAVGAARGSNPVATAAIVDGQQYTVCAGF